MQLNSQKPRMADRKSVRGPRFFWFVILVALVTCSLAAATNQKETPQGNAVAAKPPSEPVMVAQGEYKIYRQTSDGGIGPFNPALHDFAESWTLWRLADGTLQVEGNRTYEAPQFEAHKDGFKVHLSADFKILRLTEYKKLQWRPDSGPLTCDFRPGALDCNSGAQDPAQEIRLHLPLKSAYGFLWPISAFSMSNITRFPHREPGDEIPVSMLTVDEPGPENPVLMSALQGNLQFLGQDQITVAGHKWQADKFKLKVALYPPFIIWTSRQGLLLDLTLENNADRMTERGMDLIRFEQFSDF